MPLFYGMSMFNMAPPVCHLGHLTAMTKIVHTQ